ncbi:hypothetical protein ABK040_009294 [Willaertia magna]
MAFLSKFFKLCKADDTLIRELQEEGHQIVITDNSTSTTESSNNPPSPLSTSKKKTFFNRSKKRKEQEQLHTPVSPVKNLHERKQMSLLDEMINNYLFKNLPTDIVIHIFSFCNFLGYDNNIFINNNDNNFINFNSYLLSSTSSTSSLQENKINSLQNGKLTAMNLDNCSKSADHVTLMQNNNVTLDNNNPQNSFSFPLFRKEFNKIQEIYGLNNKLKSINYPPKSNANQKDKNLISFASVSGDEDDIFNYFLDSHLFQRELNSSLIKLCYGKRRLNSESFEIFSIVQHLEFIVKYDQYFWKSFPLYGKEMISLKLPANEECEYIDEYLDDLIDPLLNLNIKSLEDDDEAVTKERNKLKVLNLVLPTKIDLNDTTGLEKHIFLKKITNISFNDEILTKYLLSLLSILQIIHHTDKDWKLNELNIPIHEKFVFNDNYYQMIAQFPVKHLTLQLNFYHPTLNTKHLNSLLENKSIENLDIENVKLNSAIAEGLKEVLQVTKIQVHPVTMLMKIHSLNGPKNFFISCGAGYHQASLDALKQVFPDDIFTTL